MPLRKVLKHHTSQVRTISDYLTNKENSDGSLVRKFAGFGRSLCFDYIYLCWNPVNEFKWIQWDKWWRVLIWVLDGWGFVIQFRLCCIIVDFDAIMVGVGV